MNAKNFDLIHSVYGNPKADQSVGDFYLLLKGTDILKKKGARCWGHSD